MQVIKQNQSNQANYVRKRLKQNKLLLKHLTSQLTVLKNEQIIKFKLRQCDKLNKQRLMLERILEGGAD